MISLITLLARYSHSMDGIYFAYIPIFPLPLSCEGSEWMMEHSGGTELRVHVYPDVVVYEQPIKPRSASSRVLDQ